MQVVHKDLRKGVVRVVPENSEDVWALSTIIAPGDRVEGVTERKIKVQDKDGETTRIIKKTVRLAVDAEKLQFAEGQLRVSGKIGEGPDDIPRGSYHTLSVQQQDRITISKPSWPRYLLDKLQETTRLQRPKLLLLIFDREEAIFATLQHQQAKVLLQLKGDVAKKDREGGKEPFFKTIAQTAKTLLEREQAVYLIAASPSFWNDYLKKELDAAVLSKTVFAGVSQAHVQAIPEVLKRPELQQVLAQEQSVQEAKLVDAVLAHIAQGLAFYGLKEAEEAITTGNAEEVLVTEHLFKRMMDQGTYHHLQDLLRTAEQTKAGIKVLGSGEAQHRIDALGGIAGKRRWQIQN